MDVVATLENLPKKPCVVPLYIVTSTGTCNDRNLSANYKELSCKISYFAMINNVNGN